MTQVAERLVPVWVAAYVAALRSGAREEAAALEDRTVALGALAVPPLTALLAQVRDDDDDDHTSLRMIAAQLLARIGSAGALATLGRSAFGSEALLENIRFLGTCGTPAQRARAAPHVLWLPLTD